MENNIFSPLLWALNGNIICSNSSELEAYAGVISALRAQGDLTKEKKDLLGELSKVLR